MSRECQYYPLWRTVCKKRFVSPCLQTNSWFSRALVHIVYTVVLLYSCRHIAVTMLGQRIRFKSYFCLFFFAIIIYDKLFSALKLFFKLSKNYSAYDVYTRDGRSKNYLPIFRCKDPETLQKHSVINCCPRRKKRLFTTRTLRPYFRLDEINYLQQNDEWKKSREG